MSGVAVLCVSAWFISLFSLSAQAPGNSSNNNKPSPFLSMDNVIRDTGYDSRMRPNVDGPPVVVNCSILVKGFGPVEEATMDYSINIFLRQTWNDPRILSVLKSIEYNTDFLDLGNSFVDSVWKPDLFFENEKSAAFHTVTTDNKMLRVFRNGDVFYSVRLSLVLACPMSLEVYPMDAQYCSIYLESYGYTTNDLIFQWNDTEPVSFGAGVSTPKFTLSNETFLGECTKEYTYGTFSCVKATFFLDRDMGYYLIQVYIPSCLLVIISWLSFWLNVEAAPARVGLGITTILTVTTQMTSANAALPKVSYIKAIDVWMGACQVFVFSALLEFAAVNMATRRHGISPSHHDGDHCTKGEVSDEEWRYQSLLHARRIDYISRVIFPTVFMVFNIFYWVIYLKLSFH
ncbi:glycine receptor subunit alphaZ1-like [Lethenteron reissneri]|uniref:glycine receptor subunit alphaZ1-like n=1 Tax=Lethenteron reissneri TaxID=7753 RepID=UPI002AB6B63F|nr:glycine receptor subunit alphaZ1-like [Lethenteron reissneri]